MASSTTGSQGSICGDPDRLWIMVDIETSGPIIGTHSMTELGAAVGSKARGVIDRFEVLIAPISEHVKTSRRSFERAKVSGLAPADAMAPIRGMEQAAPRAGYVPRAPAAFDWPWIVQYAWRYLGENPFGFRPCVRRRGSRRTARASGSICRTSPSRMPCCSCVTSSAEQAAIRSPRELPRGGHVVTSTARHRAGRRTPAGPITCAAACT